jgi:predicted DNA-binding transcriptional regulator AlpA
MQRVSLKTRDQLPIQLIRKKELAKMLGVDRWTIDRYRREMPDFPRPLKFSEQVLVWDLTEIKAWLSTVQRVK